MPCVTVETLSGYSKIVDLSSSATLGDLRGAIGVELDVSSKHVQLAVGAAFLPHDGSMVLESIGVEDGTRVSAIVRQCPPLPALSNTFKVELQSSRIRLGLDGNCSSAFTMVYKLQLDVEKSHIWANVIRKNDQDHLEFDGQKGSCKGDRGHWMAGTTQIQEQPFPCFHLGDLLRDWMDRAEVVFDSEKQLWTMPSEGAITKLNEDEEEQGEELKGDEEDEEVDENGWLDESDENGWFVAPSSDCVELYVNAPFPVSRWTARNSMRIARVLVDPSGNPVRAAIYHEDGSKMCYRKVTCRKLKDGPQNVSPKDHVQKADVYDMARDGNFLLEEYDVTLTGDLGQCMEASSVSLESTDHWAVDLFGDLILTKTGKKPTLEIATGKKAILLYFSAHWCPPCRGFTPVLAATYKNYNANDIEVIFVSSDRDQASFDGYFAEMPWTALPFADREQKNKIAATFDVQGIPMLVVLDGETGQMLTPNGRGEVQIHRDLGKCLSFWGLKPESAKKNSGCCVIS